MENKISSSDALSMLLVARKANAECERDNENLRKINAALGAKVNILSRQELGADLKSFFWGLALGAVLTALIFLAI